jgi:hypothetical protein
VGDLCDSAPSVLEGYIRETDLARQLNRSVCTLQRLAARQSGPPRIKIGRLIFYRIDSVSACLVGPSASRLSYCALATLGFRNRSHANRPTFHTVHKIPATVIAHKMIRGSLMKIATIQSSHSPNPTNNSRIAILTL